MKASKGLGARGVCFADTSFFYAVLDEDDIDHEAALSLVGMVERESLSVITTWEVVVETVTLLRYRYSYRGAMAFLEDVVPGLNLVYPTEGDRAEAVAVFARLGRDRRLSLCDALSYVVVKRLGFPDCLTFDDDFEALGLTVLKAGGAAGAG